jgi:hypothetical protein
MSCIDLKQLQEIAGRLVVHGYDRGSAGLIAEAADEIAALRKDAERYRWLRDKIENQDLTIAVADSWSLRSWSGDNSDAAIDAAMKEKGKNNGNV